MWLLGLVPVKLLCAATLLCAAALLTLVGVLPSATLDLSFPIYKMGVVVKSLLHKGLSSSASP